VSERAATTRNREKNTREGHQRVGLNYCRGIEPWSPDRRQKKTETGKTSLGGHLNNSTHFQRGTTGGGSNYPNLPTLKNKRPAGRGNPDVRGGK